MVTQINKQTFLDGYEQGTINEIIVFDGKIYGRQKVYASKIPSKLRPPFRVVYAIL